MYIFNRNTILLSNFTADDETVQEFGKKSVFLGDSGIMAGTPNSGTTDGFPESLFSLKGNSISISGNNADPKLRL